MGVYIIHLYTCTAVHVSVRIPVQLHIYPYVYPYMYSTCTKTQVLYVPVYLYNCITVCYLLLITYYLLLITCISVLLLLLLLLLLAMSPCFDASIFLCFYVSMLRTDWGLQCVAVTARIV